MIRDELETPTTFANSKFVKSTNIDEKVTKQYFDCCLTKQEAVILFYELSQSAKLHFDFLILFFVEVKMSVANFDFQALTRLPPFILAPPFILDIYLHNIYFDNSNNLDL